MAMRLSSESVVRHGRRRLWVALAMPLALAWVCLGQGTIVHVTAPEEFGTFQGGSLPVDLNGDGTPDFTFVATRGDFSVDGTSSNAVVALPAGGLDLGGWAVPTRDGATLQAQLPDGLIWYATLHTQYGSLPALLTSCMDVGCIGFFTGESAYMGVRFQAADGTHYGWMFLDLPFVGINGGYIREWAYETRPNTPIKAGARPVMAAGAVPVVVRPGYLRLSWLSEIGKAYQVQAKASLDAFGWTNLNFAVPATTTNTLLDLPMTGAAQFFRVVEAD